MKRETITLMLNGLADNYISEATIFCPNAIQESPERIVHMKKKRIVTLALAAALILALSVAAYAVWSIHTERQQELKADLKIEENNVSSYMEYTATDEQASGLVLLSSVNDGQEQHVYVNISPVTKEERRAGATCLCQHLSCDKRRSSTFSCRCQVCLECCRNRDRRFCRTAAPGWVFFVG